MVVEKKHLFMPILFQLMGKFEVQFAVLTTPLLTFNITFIVPKIIYRLLFRSFYEYAHVLEPLYDCCVILGNIKIKDLKFDKKCLIDGIFNFKV